MFGRSKGLSSLSFSQLSKSGLAPKPKDAPYLAHAYNVDGCDFINKTITCRKTGVKFVMDGSAGVDCTFADEGNGRFILTAAAVTGSKENSVVNGDLTTIEADESFMIMAVGYTDGTGENQLIFRLGGFAWTTSGSPSVRLVQAGYTDETTPGQYSGDVHRFDKGEWLVAAPPYTAVREPHKPWRIDNGGPTDWPPVICIGLYNRETNTYEYRSWSTETGDEYKGITQPDSVAAIADAGTITLGKTAGDNYTSGTGFSMEGRFYGMALWKFPQGKIPTNWYEAARSMGYEWSKGRFNFYPF